MGASLATIQDWFGKQGKLSEIRVAADPGISQEEIAARVRAAVGSPRVEVKTGVKDATDQAGDVNDAIGSFLTPALLAFGVIAVFVGAFIIFNTFSITVAQRLREFAMLRTLGREPPTGAAGRDGRGARDRPPLFDHRARRRLSRGGRHRRRCSTPSASACPTNSPTLAVRTVVLALVVGVGVTLRRVARTGAARDEDPADRRAPRGRGAAAGPLARFTPAFAVVLALGRPAR